MKKCNVCFENRRLIISVQKSDKNNVNWFTKLQDVIPELVSGYKVLYKLL